MEDLSSSSSSSSSSFPPLTLEGNNVYGRDLTEEELSMLNWIPRIGAIISFLCAGYCLVYQNVTISWPSFSCCCYNNKNNTSNTNQNEQDNDDDNNNNKDNTTTSNTTAATITKNSTAATTTSTTNNNNNNNKPTQSLLQRGISAMNRNTTTANTTNANNNNTRRRRRRRRRRSIFHRIMMGCGINIMILNLNILWGQRAVPSEYQEYGFPMASGSQTTCSLQGFLYTMGFVVPSYYVALSIQCYLAIRHKFHFENYQWIEMYIHIGVYLFPIASAIYLLTEQAYNPGLIDCYFISLPRGCGNHDGSTHDCIRGPQNYYALARWLIGLPIGIILCFPSMIMLIVYLRIRLLEGSKGRQVATSVGKQAFVYLLALYWTYLFRFIFLIASYKYQVYNFGLHVISNMVEFMQGVWISMAYYYLRSTTTTTTISSSNGTPTSSRHFPNYYGSDSRFIGLESGISGVHGSSPSLSKHGMDKSSSTKQRKSQKIKTTTNATTVRLSDGRPTSMDMDNGSSGFGNENDNGDDDDDDDDRHENDDYFDSIPKKQPTNDSNEDEEEEQLTMSTHEKPEQSLPTASAPTHLVHHKSTGSSYGSSFSIFDGTGTPDPNSPWAQYLMEDDGEDEEYQLDCGEYDDTAFHLE